jgi:hypothetical protein
MNTEQAMTIVLNMAKELRATCKVQREDVEMEAIEEVESYLKASALMDEPATGCDYGIGG